MIYLVLNRGSCDTDSTHNIYALLNGSLECIKSGLNLDKNHDITVDCDAFSFIISYDEDNIQTRSAIQRLLLHFGSHWSTVTFPPVAAAIQTARTGNNDSLFGSHHSKSCLDDIKSVLHLSEVLIIDCPVKIALHQSCKEAVKRSIAKMGFDVSLSSSYGICFDHQKSTNKPSFGVVIDARLGLGLVCLFPAPFLRFIFVVIFLHT